MSENIYKLSWKCGRQIWVKRILLPIRALSGHIFNNRVLLRINSNTFQFYVMLSNRIYYYSLLRIRNIKQLPSGTKFKRSIISNTLYQGSFLINMDGWFWKIRQMAVKCNLALTSYLWKSECLKNSINLEKSKIQLMYILLLKMIYFTYQNALF